VAAGAARSTPEAPADAQNGVFYAVAQAVFLVFCFRWRDLLDEDEEGDVEELVHERPAGVAKQWMPELKILQRVVTSSLNPLKVHSGYSS